MDDSQSSDVFSESTDIFCCSPIAGPTQMETASYASMILNTKSTFTSIQTEIKKPLFPSYFCNLLGNCSICVSQSLALATHLLTETNININQLKEYMTDAICILEMLSDLIKKVMETIVMSCRSMIQFPIATGRIIMIVFTHCKDSESVYGSQLSLVERQIKDLFRTCHELQLTYLTALEKHYIFDLTQKEEHDILVEALDINLKIGEIVQSLDVKTMAEQWKAYTLMCEQHSNTLLDTHMYRDCTNILCNMLVNNIKIAVEETQDKVILRSLKVSSFILKILLRICIALKHTSVKEYTQIIELLLFVNLNNGAYLHTMLGKSSQFIDMYNNNITGPVNILIAELLNDEELLQYISDYNIETIKRDEKMLGFIHLVITTIRCLLQKNNNEIVILQKHRFVNVVYNFLPHGHIWFNLGLKYKSDNQSSKDYETYGLYECLLTHTAALTLTMVTEEFHTVERRMLEAVLSTDCVSALFASNMWTVLARASSQQLLLTQVMYLANIYQRLETYNVITPSPQYLHLGHTIGELFELMPNEDKTKIYNKFNICDVKNISLWRCLKIMNLPTEVRCNVEEFAIRQLSMQLQKFTSNDNVDIDFLIKSMHLVSTCSQKTEDDDLETSLVGAWLKACPKNDTYGITHLDKDTLWYYKYMEALVALTESMEYIFHRNSVNLVKVLHVVSNIINTGCAEFKILLIDILCKLASLELYDANKPLCDSILTETFTMLFTATDSVIKNKLFNTIRINKSDNLYRIISNVVSKDESFKDMWCYFIRNGRLKRNGEYDLKEQLQTVIDIEFCHKCIRFRDELKNPGSLVLQKKLSNNFDINMEMVFEPDSDEEPASKKSKLNASEVEQIISLLETNTSLLCNIKENVFTLESQNRIKTICNKLNNILD